MKSSCLLFFCCTELYGRSAIRASKRVSNPGCYATNTQMLLAPLMPYIDVANPPTVFGLSGYSGAGTKTGSNDEHGRPQTVPKVTPEDLHGAVRPYSLTDHIHEREASYQLANLFASPPASPFQLAFIPTVTSWFSGIISVLSAPLNQSMSAADIWKLYEEKYGSEPLVQLQKTVPDVMEASGRHGWRMGGIQVHSSGKRVVVTGALDNLLKGAATQAMQNLNLALGYEETAGIPKDKI